MIKKGYIQIYTGNGKGKTTAAIGLAVRAIGAGLKVCFCQFLKGRKCCELIAFKKYHNKIIFKSFGSNSFVIKPTIYDYKKAKRCFEYAKKAIQNGPYDIIILDEINNALSLNMININDLINLLKDKPKHKEIILTGRNAPNSLIEIADLVTEMKEVKHYFHNGVKARKGIEK